MRDPLSKTDRLEISNSVKDQFSDHMKKIGFVPCKTLNLWSREQNDCIEYIRLKRTSKFSEWPHFQFNFGFTPKFAAGIELILEALLKTDRPMYEICSHHIMPLSEHYRLNTKRLYSSAEPGTWEFRNRKEVDKKIKKIDAFIVKYFPDFISLRMNDEFISNVGLNKVDELPPSFKVLQIISFGNLQDVLSIENCISYYKNRNFGKRESRFKKPIEEYGDELLRYFKRLQTAHPHSN